MQKKLLILEYDQHISSYSITSQKKNKINFNSLVEKKILAVEMNKKKNKFKAIDDSNR